MRLRPYVIRNSPLHLPTSPEKWTSGVVVGAALSHCSSPKRPGGPVLDLPGVIKLVPGQAAHKVTWSPTGPSARSARWHLAARRCHQRGQDGLAERRECLAWGVLLAWR